MPSRIATRGTSHASRPVAASVRKVPWATRTCSYRKIKHYIIPLGNCEMRKGKVHVRQSIQFEPELRSRHWRGIEAPVSNHTYRVPTSDGR